jgi:hypothetical protein
MSAFELRSSKELHDRLVLVDGDSAWIMGGSIKDAGKKATYLIPLPSPIAAAKIAIYGDNGIEPHRLHKLLNPSFHRTLHDKAAQRR